MFEKISNAAEKLATNVSESRRGFLVRMGQAALGVAGVVGGLLALPTKALAAQSGYCERAADMGFYLTGVCVCPNPCNSIYNVYKCRPGTGVDRSSLHLCGTFVSPSHRCSC